MAAAHDAAAHEVKAGAQQVRVLVVGVVAVKEVEAQVVLALQELLVPLGPAPVMSLNVVRRTWETILIGRTISFSSPVHTARA